MDQKLIYHIYKACRLCGAGGGYKMPIYQNFVDFDIDICQKIRDCVQIEVYDGDKMPPLICGVCMDKIDEYGQFKELCRETDIRTRKKLGLPLNGGFKGTPESGNSIKKEPEDLQTKQDFQKSYDKKESALKQKENQLKNKAKELKSKEDNLKRRDTTLKKLDLELKTLQQQLKSLDEQLKAKETKIQNKETELENSKQLQKEKIELKRDIQNLKAKESYWRNKQMQTQKNFEIEVEKLKLKISKQRGGSDNLKRKKNSEVDEQVDRSSRSSSVSSRPGKRSKRSVTPNQQSYENSTQSTTNIVDRSSRSSSVSSKTAKRSLRSVTPNQEEHTNAKVPSKKTKEKEAKFETPTSRKIKLPSPKSTKTPTDPPEVDDFECSVCRNSYKNRQAKASHLSKMHLVTFTSPRLACDACKLWFVTNEEAAAHHRLHKSDNILYKCDYCEMKFDTDKEYHSHFSKYDCIPFYIVPDVQCLDCWNYFATETLKSQHKCLGEDGRPGGKCGKCSRGIDLWKDLIIHEATCKENIKTPSIANLENVKVDPDVRSRLLPMQVRLIKCDALLKTNEHDYCDVGAVKPDFGLDKNQIYPYLLRFKVKQEPIIPIDHMVSINPEVRDDFFTSYINWDSDDLDSDDEHTNISLTKLCLRVIYSKQMLGKVPRRKKRVILEKAFDGMSDNEDFNIDNIIDSLGDNIDNDTEHIDGNKDMEARIVDNEDESSSKFNTDSNIKLLRIDFENNDDGATENTDVVPNNTNCDTNNVDNNTLEADMSSENQSKVEENRNEQIFHSIDSPESNVNDENMDNVAQTEDNKTNDETELHKSQNSESNDINTDTNSINDVTDSDKCQNNVEFSNTESNSYISINKTLDENSTNDTLDNNETNNDDIDMKTTNDAEAIINKSIDQDNNEKQTELSDTISSSDEEFKKILENNTKVDEDKTDIVINRETQNTEIDILMKDLSDLSKTDDVQDDKINKTNTNIEKSESDSENDKFMKELDEQIGENANEQTDDVKENNCNETNVKNDGTNNLKVDNFDDFNQINKELEQRMDRDLDSISDEDFDFDA